MVGINILSILISTQVVNVINIACVQLKFRVFTKILLVKINIITFHKVKYLQGGLCEITLTIV